MTSEFKFIKLGDIASVNYGYTAKASRDKIGPRFLRITDIGSSGVDWSTVPFCRIGEQDQEKHRLKSGDIVFARTGATTGKSYLITDPPDAVYASYLIRLSLRNGSVLPEFLSLYFQTNRYWQTITRGISGSAQGGFNASKLSVMEVPLPSLLKQKRIVTILDESFAAIDKAIANTEKNLTNARELFESYLNNVFTQKGEGWVEKKLGEVCSITSKLIDPRDSEYVDLRHVGAGNMVTMSQELVDVKTAKEEGLISGKFHFDGKMVLYSKIRPYLMKVAIPDFDGLCSADIYPLTPKNTVLERGFLYFLLLSRDFTDYAIAGSQRAGMPKVNRDCLFEYSNSYPNIVEQKKIVSHLTQLSFECKRIESKFKNKLTALTELKQSILQKAFTGKLTAKTIKRKKSA